MGNIRVPEERNRQLYLLRETSQVDIHEINLHLYLFVLCLITLTKRENEMEDDGGLMYWQQLGYQEEKQEMIDFNNRSMKESCAEYEVYLNEVENENI